MSARSLHQLLNMLDSIAEGIFCVDLSGRCSFCNTPCVSLLGYDSKEELLGQDMHSLIHHHHRDGRVYEVETCQIYRAYHEDRNVHVDNEVFFRKDGSRFDAEYWSYPFKEGDTIVGAIVSFMDITVRREEFSHRSHLARLVESSADAIISRDLEGRITSWNRGATQIYGYDAEEALQKKISDLILPPNQADEEEEILTAVAEGRELLQFEVSRRHKTGEPLEIALTISPIVDADGRLIGCSSVERDISERRRSQDAVLRALSAAEMAEKKADRANRSRGEFLANVSHELRTPMNAILGMLQLSIDEPLPPLVRDYLSVAKSSADSLLGLVNELLDFAKIESGKFEISSYEFELREAIDIPAKALATRASEKGLELLCEIENDVPNRLTGDGRRIQQVITNLLSNAVKFTERGEIFIRVQPLRRLPNEVRLRFSVADTGVGIAPEDMESIMLPFQQADMSSTRQQHGTGLGLSICRELISLMGGKLQLESEVGKGSRFWFDLLLPIAVDEPVDHSLPSELVEGLNVLIVDDNPTNLRILEKTFVGWSMQPILSENAEQALRVVDEAKRENREISLALIDCLMPQIDGFELAERLAEKSGAECPPIVMMQSAADLSLFSDRKADSPVRQYLTKPVSQSELLNTVVDTLDLYSQTTLTNDLEKVGDDHQLPLRPLSILLVEDLPANQKVAEAILQKRGHSVTIAGNGRVALDKVISAEPFDLILMDVQMPVMDGIQATAAIRALDDPRLKETPIVAMTAHAMQGDREFCLAAGMDAYLAKPLDVKDLIETIESMVQHPRSEHERAHEAGADVPPAPTELATNAPRRAKLADSVESIELVDHHAALKRLGGDEQLFREFIDIFMADAPPLLEELQSAYDGQDPPRLERAAHALKGLMSNFGAQPCCDLALEIERAGREGRMPKDREKIDRLRELYKRLSAELRQRFL